MRNMLLALALLAAVPVALACILCDGPVSGVSAEICHPSVASTCVTINVDPDSLEYEINSSLSTPLCLVNYCAKPCGTKTWGEVITCEDLCWTVVQ